MRIFTLVAAVVLGVGVSLSAAQATPIVGGSNLLDSNSAQRLEDWLGQGAITLTKIYDNQQQASTNAAWHAAVDGQGPTFTVLSLTNGFVLGGYNQSAWSSIIGYNHVDWQTSDSFLFSLTGDMKLERNRLTYDTYNNGNYAATFGGGHDLYTNLTYNRFYANIGYTYGDLNQYTLTSYRNAFAGVYQGVNMIDKYETFTIQYGAVEVPEPKVIMILLGIVCCLALRKRERCS